MSSVTERIKSIKQPYGGYIRASQFKEIVEDDGLILNENENVHTSVVGMAVDYLTRFIGGAKKEDAFEFSLRGAKIAETNGKKNYYRIALNLLGGIDGLNEKSIINACKIVTFDVWYRNVSSVFFAKEYYDINPDKATIQNIQILVSRGLSFFKIYGPITQSGFTFGSVTSNG